MRFEHAIVRVTREVRYTDDRRTKEDQQHATILGVPSGDSHYSFQVSNAAESGRDLEDRERSSIRSNLCASPRASSVTPQLNPHCITIPKSSKFENEPMGEVGQRSSQIHPAVSASTNAHCGQRGLRPPGSRVRVSTKGMFGLHRRLTR